jgi:acyl-CoA reductase-like NAD-dependent aldehyde dehydrogenase
MMLTIVDPATECVIAELPAADAREVDAAVAAADRALPGWRASRPSERRRILARLADLIDERTDELAELEALNVGKPIADAREEVAMSAELVRYYAHAIDKHCGQTIPIDGGLDVTLYEPVGVVALIVPWNFPLNTACTKLAPALATGNTVVLKPSELTPLTALRLAGLAAEAGLPDGVLNVIVGDGPTTGARLVEHPSVAKIAFTGSTAVGREIMSRASASLKKVSLELGGKSAAIVFADADVAAAAEAAPAAVFGNAGQDCCARSRLLVEASVLDELLERLIEATRRFRVGRPHDPGVQMGPLISERHHARVASFVGENLTVAFRGDVPAGRGYWYPPTILAPVAADAAAAREEIFGPVLCVTPFHDEAEAIQLANDSPYGLSGSIWTRSLDRALRVAGAIHTGVLSVNSNSSVFVSTPFGGVKQSGFGRENGMEAMREYTAVKNVFIATNDHT